MSLFKRLSSVFRGRQDRASESSDSGVSDDKSGKIVRVKRKPSIKSKGQSQLKSRPVKKSPSVSTDAIIREAQAKAREIVLEAKDEAIKIREEAEKKAKIQDEKARQSQSEMDSKSHQLDRKEAVLEEKERYLKRLESEADKLKSSLEDTKKRLIEKLEEVASLSREEAKQQIFEAVEKRSSKEIARIIREAQDKAEEEAEDKAKEIIIESMKHGATDYVAEFTVSTVELPSDDIKGRLIGKEGRNIRAFEKATGVDLDLDETPGMVRLSSFDSVRREIAKLALKRLIQDGRIQPTRIEEYVQRAQKDINRVMFEEGKKLCHAVGVYNLPKDLIQMLGKFKYRSSYGQNMIAHTLEETKIGIALAHEIKADVDTVRLGCLLHDIGKVVTDEEGSHVDLGVKLLKKYQMPQPVIDAVAQHHEDIPFTSNESILVYIADAISGARPGARMENYDDYVKRLETLEEIAKSYKGVRDAYAIQAGREVRVLTNHSELTDDETVVLADKIRDRIKNELTYPGTVTVNVIREVRAKAVAT